MKTDWAGASMTIPPVSEPYQQTVGALAEQVRAGSGGEPNDPAKVAKVVLDVAGRDDAPVRLLLGPDAVQYAAQAAQALADSDAQWRQVSESTVA